MSPTLFRYIFWDLIKFFGLTSGALAGIMSFGGLLRPLTQHGLDASQVGRMLTYFMPAMSTYSLPIAALFATTVVYGRLAADNELTAMRAGGISYLAIATPALLLGMVVSIISLLLLCFLVPFCTLQVERIVYSNLAQLIANSIERTHEVRFGEANVFAQSAYVPERDPKNPNEQRVVLIAPTIITYEGGERPGDLKSHTPRDFLMAQQATVFIKQDAEDEEPELFARLTGGLRFPRRFEGGAQVGIGDTQFGPETLPALIRENTKFMDIRRLKELWVNRGQSQRVRESVRDFVRADQRQHFAKVVEAGLTGPQKSFTFTRGNETYSIGPAAGAKVVRHAAEIVIASQPGLRQVEYRETENGRVTVTAEANEVRMNFRPDKDSTRMYVTLELYDAAVHTGDVTTARGSFPRSISVAMPEEIAELRKQPAQYYVTSGLLSQPARDGLRRAWIVTGNDVLGEMHSRASFAVSCLILVMVGCVLGMMFKSGNFLTAFAVSVVPAMMCIMLIVTGQHTVENVPMNATTNPLNLGLVLIWSGNLAVLAIAVVLLGRLQKQ